MKVFFISIGAFVLLLVGFLIWSSFQPQRERAAQPGVVSASGLHWHPELTIYVKGVRQDLPANLGIVGSSMAPIHTHEADGVIHLEFQGLVRKSDITLGQFFKNWGKDIRSFGTNVTMTVNGKENTEYENYVMHDGDKIELSYD